ncbi:hypothetical protein SteCoe_5879 [Stentor coeruleus]|uniref:Uncharacterized protein n=1 Tax=Stentor coeruleus TaxID=5963 RepID=A0A1R2CR79_9CILI|nr:hypothetical protein SteCoe_5879 [Stentor coeruleus]
MKKNSLAEQIEQKIRQMNERYNQAKKSSTENVIKSAIPSSPTDRINDILRKDLKRHLPLIKLRNSKDVSHIKDSKSPKSFSSLSFLPSDLPQLKKLAEPQFSTFDTQQNSIAKTLINDQLLCRSPDFDEHTIEMLEKFDSINPSSRKEAENLLNWFNDMKSKHENDDDYESVVLFCEKELTKQVFVECKPRGRLLRKLFAYYHNYFYILKESYEQVLNKLTSDYEKTYENTEKQHNNTLSKLKNTIGEMKNSIIKQENISKGLEDEVKFYKQKLHNMQRVYLEEQEMWRKMSIERMKKSAKRGDVFLNSSYNLAVAKWRQDLCNAEIQENTAFEDIKKKLDNEDILDPEEIKAMNELFLKKHEEMFEENYVDIETQTEEQEKEKEKENEENMMKKYEDGSEMGVKVVVHTVVVEKKHNEVEKKDKKIQTEDFEESDEEDEDIFETIKKIIKPEDLEDFGEGFDDDDDGEYKKIGFFGMKNSSSFEGTPNKWPSGNRRSLSPDFSEFVASFDRSSYERTGEELKTIVENDEEFDRKRREKVKEKDKEKTEGKYFHRKNEDKEKIEGKYFHRKNDDKEKIEGKYFHRKNDDKGIENGENEVIEQGWENEENYENEEIIEGKDENVENSDIRNQEKNANGRRSLGEMKNAEKAVKGNTDKQGKTVGIKNQQWRGLDGLRIPEKNPEGKTLALEKKDKLNEKTPDLKDPEKLIENPQNLKDPIDKSKGVKKSDTNKDKIQLNTKSQSKLNLEPEDKKYQKAEKSFLIPDSKDKSSERLNKSFQNLESKDLANDPKNTKIQSKRQLSISNLEDKSLKGTKPASRYEEDPNISQTPKNSLNKPIPRASFQNKNQPSKSSRRISVPINLQNSTALLQDLLTGKLGSNLKNTTKNLVKNIENKKKELAELESLIEMKRKVLKSSENSDFSDSEVSNSPRSEKSSQKRHFSTGEVLTRVVLNLNNMQNLQGENELKSPESTEKIIRQLINEEMKKNKALSKDNKRNSHLAKHGETIDEENENEVEDENKKSENSQDKWKHGYEVGYQRGKTKGFLSGKTLGREEGIAEGYRQAFKDMNQDDSLLEDSENESKTQEGNSISGIPQNKSKSRKPYIPNEIKSSKELTKFAEFKFASQRPVIAKISSPAPDLIKRLLKRSYEMISKKAKASRKFVNKLISSTYQTAISRIPLESNEELFEICYEDFTQKYGLRKVADRKFLELIASVIKNKSFRKQMMFIKLSGLGKTAGIECYSNMTLSLYLDRLQYMLNSKIGITMNYEEADDHSYFPLNRAIECVKEKLECYFDKTFIMSLIPKLEQKSIADPQRINSSLVDLDYTLELICDVYEIYLNKIRKGLNEILISFNYELTSPILQYDLALAIRHICPNKFQKLESEDILNQELTQEEAYQFCVEMNVLNENDINTFAKSYNKVPYENYMELTKIIDLMEQTQSTWISISEDEWRIRLERCMKKWDQHSQNAIIAWRVYESELKRIQSEYL